MKIFPSNTVRQADAYTIKNEPISSEALMERAASAFTDEILGEFFLRDSRAIIIAGPGNNGGDGLVIARLLYHYMILSKVYIAAFTDNYSDDFRLNLKRLKEQTDIEVFEIREEKDFPELEAEDILIDALFGSGLSRPLEGLPQIIVEKMNASGNSIFSVDIPSGLYGEENNPDEQTIIKAEKTYTFEFPFLSFMFPENEEYIGEFEIIPIGIHPDFIAQTPTDYFFGEDEQITLMLKKRSKFSHKGTFGHALVLSGSYGKAGAGLLAVKAAHRTGAGLVTAGVPLCNYQIFQLGSPETMLHIDTTEKFLSTFPKTDTFNTIGIGPGIGFAENTKAMLFKLCQNFNKPMVLDADALTILSESPEHLFDLPENTILTPHPKEFERLAGKSFNNYEQLQKQRTFAQKYKVILVVKGAHTAVALPDGNVYFNNTGNNGMATGGSGDVLTGILTGLLAQGYEPQNAAVLGVHLHGIAGDIAARKRTPEALIASDLIKYLPKAWKKVRNRLF